MPAGDNDVSGTVSVGTCGYRYFDPDDDWREDYDSVLQAYSAAFDVGEVKRTFYRLNRDLLAKTRPTATRRGRVTRCRRFRHAQDYRPIV